MQKRHLLKAMKLNSSFKATMVSKSSNKHDLPLENDIAEAVSKVAARIHRNKQLNIMVCGAAGIGKTSFIRLFLKKFNHKEAERIINSVE